MKLHADPISTLNTVTAYGPGFIEINKVRHANHVIITPDQPVRVWSIDGLDALSCDDFSRFAADAPEIVLLGTGSRQRFLHPQLTQPLMRAHIGFEVMDTPAACRTYNILMSEGRRVLAALLLEA